jgi:hypothetical protein
MRTSLGNSILSIKSKFYCIRLIFRLKGIVLLLFLGGFIQPPDGRAETAVVDGEALVHFVDGTSESARNAFESTHGLKRVRHITFINVYHYTFQGVDVWTKLSMIRASELVFYAEPNYLRNRQSVTSDRFYEYQWYLPSIRWDQARGEFTGQELVKVAVIDSGVSKAHSHLLGYLLQQGEWDFAGGDADANDESGHGTMVAGIITGNTDEGEGVAGICPTARILPIRVFDNAGFPAEGSAVDSSVLAKALEKAWQAGAKIANMSLGGGAYSQTEWLALKKCQDAGMLVVCAAGNGGRDEIGDNNDSSPIYPASYNLDCIISVAATDESDRLSIFSNHGASSVDVAAPGENIRVCDVPRSTLYEWNFNTGWEGWQPYAISGYGWVWDNFTGEWGLSTSGSFFSYFAGYYAANSSMGLISPELDLRGKVGARVEFDVSGSLGIGDYIELSFEDSSGNSNNLGKIAYPGWTYSSLDQDISTFDGGIGRLTLDLKADLYGWGTYSSGIFTFQNIRVTVLDQSSWAVDSNRYVQGTSFSAPIVSGIAAALFSQAPSLTAPQVKNLILTTARPVAGLNGKLLYPAVVDYAAALRAAKALSTSTEQTPPLEFLDEIIGTWKGAQTVYVGGTKVTVNLTSTISRHGQRGLYITHKAESPEAQPGEVYQYLYDNGLTQGGFLPGSQAAVNFSATGTWVLENNAIKESLFVNLNGSQYSQETQRILVDKNTLNIFSATSYGAKILGVAVKVPENFSLVSADFTGNFLNNSTLGQVCIKLSRGGSFSGFIVSPVAKYPFKGSFSASGKAAVTFKQPLGTLDLTLKTNGLADGKWDAADEVLIEAVLGIGEEKIALELRPSSRKGALKSPLAGKTINTLIESRNESRLGFGYGFASVKPGKDGVFRFAGALADGTKLTGTARAVEDGAGGWNLPVAMPLPSVKGFLHGVAAIDEPPTVEGFHLASEEPWTWTRPANARAKSFPSGFSEKLNVRGREWKWNQGTSALGGSSANFTIALSFGDSSGGFVPVSGVDGLGGVLGASNKPTWTPSPPKGFTMKIVPATGLFSGIVPAIQSGKAAMLPYQGVLFSENLDIDSVGAVLGVGFISGSGSSGVMKITRP